MLVFFLSSSILLVFFCSSSFSPSSFLLFLVLTRNKGTNDKANVNHGIGKENEPAVAGALFELAGGLGASDTARGVLATNTDTDKEAPGGENVKEANGAAVPVGTRGEGGKDDEEDGGGDEGVGAGPVIRGEAKDELA